MPQFLGCLGRFCCFYRFSLLCAWGTRALCKQAEQGQRRLLIALRTQLHQN